MKKNRRWELCSTSNATALFRRRKIVLGAVSLSKMTTDLLPDMSFQYALVVTTDMGASPEQVESDVTAPIESAMATTSNIKNISSVSYNSYSVVTLEYEQNANMDSVVIEIQQSLDQVSGQWDDSIGTPMIMKVNPDMMLQRWIRMAWMRTHFPIM